MGAAVWMVYIGNRCVDGLNMGAAVWLGFLNGVKNRAIVISPHERHVRHHGPKSFDHVTSLWMGLKGHQQEAADLGPNFVL